MKATTLDASPAAVQQPGPVWRVILRWYLPILFLGVAAAMNARLNGNLRGVLWSDVEGYYMYLPAVFILNDVHQVQARSMNARQNERGETVIKYTYGVSVFYLPFFAGAYVVSSALGADASDYFNDHYGRAIGWCGYFFGFLGLFVLQRQLRRVFSEKTAFWTVLSIFAGTNLFHYMTKEPGMSHAYSFLIFALFNGQTRRFLERRTAREAAVLGLLFGWAVLIRPTNVLIALWVLGYGVTSWAELGQRVRALVADWKQLAVAALAAVVPLLPQMWYWRVMTGHWVRYSYEGEDFRYWNRPKILEVLFDTQNGLLLYSPILVFALIGLALGWRDRRAQAPVVAALFVVATYIFASWWAWWFGGAFGHRSYIEFFALLAFPMALFYERVAQWKRVARWPVYALAVFLMFYSVRMSYLYIALPGGNWDGPQWQWAWHRWWWVQQHLFRFEHDFEGEWPPG